MIDAEVLWELEKKKLRTIVSLGLDKKYPQHNPKAYPVSLGFTWSHLDSLGLKVCQGTQCLVADNCVADD